MNKHRFSLLLIIPLLLFSALFLPFIGIQPCYDGAGSFENAKSFFQNGLNGYLLTKSLHPPFEYILLYPFFLIFGAKIEIVSLVGYVYGIAAIVGMYFLAKILFDKRVALISALLLSVCPLFITNGVHLIMDYMLVTYFIIALYFYAKKNFLLFAIFSSMVVLTKDTALLLPFSVLLTEVLHNGKEIFLDFRPKTILRMTILATPLLIYALWFSYIKLHGLDAWSENIFAETKSKGAFGTILINFLTFNFFHEWALRHRLFLFILNFNWVYFLLFTIGIGYSVKEGKLIKSLKLFLTNDQREKTKLNIIIFSILYFFTVLSFQTFPAPRYALMILIFLYLGIAVIFSKHIKKIPIYFFVIFSVFLVARLYYSIDPLSITIWSRRPAFYQQNDMIYRFDDVTWGNDAIVYNLQYLMLLRNKEKEIKLYQQKNHTDNDKSAICAVLLRGR